MLELLNDMLNFSFENVHKHAKLGINFQRTIRIPDDGKTYPLPDGFGRFPIRHVDDYKDKVPAKWIEHGGTMIPMYQSEALWIKFEGHFDPERRVHYPFAIKVSTGKVSAITGEKYQKGLQKDDYCVAPDQRWIDGYVVEKGKIRQFVAAPMGSGVSVEKQITGKDEFGGIQIEVFPMKRSEYESRFPIYQQPKSKGRGPRRAMLRSTGMNFGSSWSGSPMIGSIAGASFSTNDSTNFSCSVDASEQSIRGDASIMAITDMSMAAGGIMDQQILSDKYGEEVWDTENSSRCFVHLTNSMVWQAITGSKPPETPMTADFYARNGYPWYDYYVEQHMVSASEKLKDVKSVMASQTTPILPENQSVNISSGHVNIIGEKKSPNAVKDGAW